MGPECDHTRRITLLTKKMYFKQRLDQLGLGSLIGQLLFAYLEPGSYLGFKANVTRREAVLTGIKELADRITPGSQKRLVRDRPYPGPVYTGPVRSGLVHDTAKDTDAPHL